MVKPTIKKIEEVGSKAGYQKGFWALVVGVAFAISFLIHIESSRARTQDSTERQKITVERLPSSEARKMGVDSRNH